MEFISRFQLAHKTDAKLGALLHAFNQAIARRKPFTREWSNLVFSVDNILSERKRRVEPPGL
jgi:hypothetical protein